MKIDLTRLRSGVDKEISIQTKYSFSPQELVGTDILELNDVSVDGIVFMNVLHHIALDLQVSGIMILPCAITLKPVEYPFDITIEGEIEDFEENDKNIKKTINTLDLLPIIWENILMEIPMKVVSEEAKNISLSGDGWSFTTEEDKEVSSPFAELIDMIDDSEVR